MAHIFFYCTSSIKSIALVSEWKLYQLMCKGQVFVGNLNLTLSSRITNDDDGDSNNNNSNNNNNHTNNNNINTVTFYCVKEG